MKQFKRPVTVGQNMRHSLWVDRQTNTKSTLFIKNVKTVTLLQPSAGKDQQSYIL